MGHLASGQSTSVTSGATDTLSGIDVQGGAGKVLFVATEHRRTATQAIQDMSYGGQALTFLEFVGAGTSVRLEVWYLLNPPSGTNDLVVNWTASVAKHKIAWVSRDDIDTAGTPFGTVVKAIATSSAPSLSSISATVGAPVIAFFGWRENTSDPVFTASNGTTRVNGDSATAGRTTSDVGVAIVDDIADNTSETMAGSLTQSVEWHVVALRLNPAPSLTAVGADLVMPWKVNASVGADLVAPWVDKQAVAADVAMAWVDRQAVGVDFVAPWVLRALVGADLGVPWRNLVNVGAELASPWQVFARVAGDLELSWAISTTTTVGLSLDMRWDVLNRLGVSVEIPWGVRQAINQQLALVWVIRTIVQRDVELRWMLTSPVAADLEIEYDLIGRVVADLNLRWKIAFAGVLPVEELMTRSFVDGPLVASTPDSGRLRTRGDTFALRAVR